MKKHDCDLHNVYFECDSDCRTFAKDAGLKYKDPGYVHILSDIVAWSNNRRYEPDGTITMDLTSRINNKLNRIIK